MKKLITLSLALLLFACGGGKASKLPTIEDPRAQQGQNQVPEKNLPEAIIPAETHAEVPTAGGTAVTVPVAGSDEVKAVAETVDINSVLPATSRRCNDSNFGKGNLEACWNGESTISRFDSITLLFSLNRAVGRVPEEMLRKLLEQNFSLQDADGKKVEGRLIWKDLRTLMFDPYAELKPSSSYRVVIASNAKDGNRPRSNQGRILSPFQFNLETQAAFFMTHSLNGKAMPSDRGLSLDSRSNAVLNMESHIDGVEQAKRISIRRLGVKAETILCDGNCQESSLVYELKDGLAPVSGLNSYEYKIEGSKGEEVYRHYSLAWGAINLKPDAPIEGGLYAAIDREDGLKALSKLVGDYAAGRFTMDYRDETSAVHPKLSFNDIIRFKRTMFAQGVPEPCDPKAPTDFEYLRNLGPYCGLKVEGDTGVLGGVLGQVHYKAVTDIYVTDMQIVQEEGNVEAAMRPEHENMAIHLAVKKFKGRLRIVLKINEAKYFGAIPVPGATGYFFYDTDFNLDGPIREAIAKTDVSVENGRLRLKIRGSDSFDLTKAIQGDESSATYFNTQAWVQNVTVSAVDPIDESQGLWAKLVNTVVDQAVNSQVETFKPQIVNGIARDILQVVAPNALNTLVEQLKTGLQIFLPSHLPSPLDRTKINVSGQLGKTVGMFVRDDNSYLTAAMQLSLKSLVENPERRPQDMEGGNGYIQTANAQRAPSPLTAGDNFGNGSLLAVSIDVVNQTLYDVWKQGMLSLRIDNNFVSKVEQFAVFDPQNQANGKEILLAEFLPKLMGSDISRMQGKDVDGKAITMEKTDKISIAIDARLPPFLKVKKAARGDGRDDLRFALGLSDVLMSIEGIHNDQRYAIAKIRLATTADSRLKFVPYQNPMRHPEFSGLGALGVEISQDTAGLDYMVEVIEGPDANSFAIDAARLRATINDMVDRLFIPLLNDALREVPLTGLRTCGVELDAAKMEILPLPRSDAAPFLLLKAPLKNYSFAGHCDLMPDLTSPLPPLPDVVDVPDDTPPPLDPGTGTGTGDASRVELAMDFSLIPWTLNGKGKAPELDEECKTQIFFDVSCAVASVEYEQENGVIKKDDRGRPIYDYTHIKLATLVPKSAYGLRGAAPSVEAQFFDFARWPEYVRGAEDNIIFNDSIPMTEVDTQYGRFKRHYVDFETNSPKASGFIPIRDVTMHRALEQPFEGAEVSTEFFVDTSANVAVPTGKPALKGAEGLDYHVGNIHIYDCAKLSWCQDSSQWVVIYDSKLRPKDKSIPEDVVPYLKAGLNAIIAGMFPL